MENGTSGLSAADLALLNNNNDGWGANGGSWFWILALFFLFFGFGGNGWGSGNAQQNMTDAVIAGQGGYVTNSQMNNAMQFESLQQSGRDTIAAVNQSKYDTADTLSSIEQRITAQEADVLNLGNRISEKQNTCCQEMLRGIDASSAQTAQGIAQIGYQSAQNTAAINANTTAQTQKILDALAQNKIESLQNQVNQLQLANATSGVLRYPNSFSYAMANPFCNCGTGCCGNM